MPELIQSALPFLPATLGAVLLLSLAPLCDRSGRAKVAALLAIGAIGLVVLAVQQASAQLALDVVNPFPVGPDGRVERILVERVTAAGWQWPTTAAVLLALPALWIFATVGVATRAPSPVAHGFLIGVWVVVARLVLEKNAAPGGLVWATGLSIVLPMIVVFGGVYAAHRRMSFGRFVLALLWVGVVQRATISAIGLFVTTGSRGTHLDVGALDDLHSPLLGRHEFGDDLVAKWLWAVLVPQMTIWVAFTVVVGLLFGGVAFKLSKR